MLDVHLGRTVVRLGWLLLSAGRKERCEQCGNFTDEQVWGYFEPCEKNGSIRTHTVCAPCAEAQE